MARFTGGWVKIRRKALLGDINSNYTRGGLFCALVSMANLQASTVSWRGKPRTLARGEIVTSFRELADLGEVDRSTVARHLNYLALRGTLSVEKSNRGILIKLLKYDLYQSVDADGPHQAPTQAQQQSHFGHNNSPTHIEELKNIRIQEGAVANFPEDLDFKNLLHPTTFSDLRLSKAKELAEIENLIFSAFEKEIPPIIKASKGRFAATVFHCYSMADLSVADFRNDLNSIINESRATPSENPEGWRQYVATRIANQSKAVLSASRAIS